MTRPRDNQRSRVYAAENATFTYGQTIPNDALQSRADEILDMRAIRSRWGIRRAVVRLGRNGGWNRGDLITLGVACRNEWMLCHELAHFLTPDGCASHGPEYVGVYLFLIERVLGKGEAARLREEMKARRVKRSRRGIPAVMVVVPPSRAERERLLRQATRRLAS